MCASNEANTSLHIHREQFTLASGRGNRNSFSTTVPFSFHESGLSIGTQSPSHLSNGVSSIGSNKECSFLLQAVYKPWYCCMQESIVPWRIASYRKELWEITLTKFRLLQTLSMLTDAKLDAASVKVDAEQFRAAKIDVVNEPSWCQVQLVASRLGSERYAGSCPESRR